jgi:hypothetical protein
MKKIILVLFTIVLAIGLTNCGESGKKEGEKFGNKSAADFQKRYGVKSAIVEYDLSGSREGTKTLYFDDWGMRQAEYTRSVISVSGYTKALNLVNIIDGEYQYIINLDLRAGTKKRNPLLKQIEDLRYEKGFNGLGEQLLLQMGAEKIGTDNFLGKDCDLYEIKKTGTKLWIWDWITLKSETNSRGINYSEVARKIDVDASIPPGKFAIPEKVVLNEVDLDNIENEMREENK